MLLAVSWFGDMECENVAKQKKSVGRALSQIGLQSGPFNPFRERAHFAFLYLAGSFNRYLGSFFPPPSCLSLLFSLRPSGPAEVGSISNAERKRESWYGSHWRWKRRRRLLPLVMCCDVC